MSDPNLDKDNMYFINKLVFLLMLDSDLTKQHPPFYVTNLLIPYDFGQQFHTGLCNGDKKAPFNNGDDFLLYLERIFQTIANGFNNEYIETPKLPEDTLLLLKLFRGQWLCVASQVLVVIHEGFNKSCLATDPVTFNTNLGHNKSNALHNLAKAIGALNQFFINPMAVDLGDWIQCIQCL